MESNFKICPNCGEKNNPQFEECWKCHYSSSKGTISNPQDRQVKDPDILRGLKRLSRLRSILLSVFGGGALLIFVLSGLKCNDSVLMLIFWVLGASLIVLTVMLYKAICPNCGDLFYKWYWIWWGISLPKGTVLDGTCYACGISLSGQLPQPREDK